jgi:hypothetical protein
VHEEIHFPPWAVYSFLFISSLIWTKLSIFSFNDSCVLFLYTISSFSACGLCNDVVSNSDYTVLNSWMKWEACWRVQMLPNLRYSLPFVQKNSGNPQKTCQANVLAQIWTGHHRSTSIPASMFHSVFMKRHLLLMAIISSS